MIFIGSQLFLFIELRLCHSLVLHLFIAAFLTSIRTFTELRLNTERIKNRKVELVKTILQPQIELKPKKQVLFKATVVHRYGLERSFEVSDSSNCYANC